MSKIYWLTCPQCHFAYYIGAELLKIKNFPTICPKCHHEYQPGESATEIKGAN